MFCTAILYTDANSVVYPTALCNMCLCNDFFRKKNRCRTFYDFLVVVIVDIILAGPRIISFIMDWPLKSRRQQSSLRLARKLEKMLDWLKQGIERLCMQLESIYTRSVKTSKPLPELVSVT